MFFAPCSLALFPGNVREISGRCPGDIREISGKYRGNIREMSGKDPQSKPADSLCAAPDRCMSRQLPGHFPDIFPDNFPNISRTFTGHFPDISQQFSGHFPAIPRTFLGKIQEKCWRHPQNPRPPPRKNQGKRLATSSKS